MLIDFVRSSIERHYEENGVESGEIYSFGIVSLSEDGESIINITAEAEYMKLVGMTDISIVLENWPMTVHGTEIVIGVTLRTTFYNSHPDYDINNVEIWQAKASDDYSDEDIAIQLKNEWNEKH